MASLILFMPLSTPRKALQAAKAPRASTTEIHSTGEAEIPIAADKRELNWIAAKPNEVARPRTVAMIASSSTTTPAGRCTARGRMSTVASRKVRVLPRLWWE